MKQKGIAKKMLPVIKAIADSKTVQIHNGKEQKRYRPFKDCDEMIEHYHEKYKSAVGCDLYFPSLGLKYGSCVYASIYKWIDMKELFDNFTFLDGSPCGCWR